MAFKFRNPFRGPAGPVGPAGVMGATGPAGLPGRDLDYVPEWVPASEDVPASHPLPSFAHGQDAGQDLHSLERVHIPAGGRATVRTGVAIKDGLRVGYVGKVEDRSGLAKDHGVTVLGGVVDPGYTGEVHIVLFNTSRHAFYAPAGHRIAQFVTYPAQTGRAPSSERGGDGFGSTGTTAKITPSVTSGARKPVRRPRSEDVDLVNHPPHYANHRAFKGEAWDYTRHMTFAMGNAFKYLWRAGEKDVMVRDLKKATWYLSHAAAGEFRHNLTEDGVAALQDSLGEYVRSHKALRDYASVLDLDSPHAVVDSEDRATVFRIAQVEAWTALVLMLQDDDRAALALARATRLANSI